MVIVFFRKYLKQDVLINDRSSSVLHNDIRTERKLRLIRVIITSNFLCFSEFFTNIRFKCKTVFLVESDQTRDL